MIQGITFTSGNMNSSAVLCATSMLKYGCQRDFVFRSWDIDKDFQYLNKEIYKQGRGHGFWLWKPYIINIALGTAADNDILIYSDAGIEFVAPIQPLIDAMDQDIFFFDNNFPHIEWCKADIMYAINRWVKFETFRHIKQVQASSIFIRVNEKTRVFFKEWLLWCQFPDFIDDSPSKIPNCETFAENRHDQAILTACAIKHGYRTHWFPSLTAAHIKQYHPEDSYGPIFNHHRRRDAGRGDGQPEW